MPEGTRTLADEAGGVQEWLRGFAEGAVTSVEAFGGLMILGGALWATVLFAAEIARGRPFRSGYHAYRENLGRAIILGLEVLIAADIVETIIVDPSLLGVATLGSIVLVRTFLSFTLATEIEGVWPWRRAQLGQPRRGEAP